MQVFRVFYGVRGFAKLNDYAIRWTRMVTEKAQQKFKILAFWKRYGLRPTLEAYPVKERTLYFWQAKLKRGSGHAEALNDQSKRPKRLRRRQWPTSITHKIKELRLEHPNLGKEKIQVLLKQHCQMNHLTCPSVSTIGNLIRDMGGLRRRPVKVRHNGTIVPRKRAKITRKPKMFQATYPGNCGSLDTVEKVIHGCRRYVLTFTDVYSRFSLAWATTSHASKAAKEFFELVTFLFPFPFAYILTDNGSEFMKEFEKELKRLHLIHWHTYPKTPKMNAHCERFNRSIQEEYVDYHEGALLNPDHFNAGLMKYLLWYNTERPHHGLKLQTPIQFITTNHPKDCNMYLTNTEPFQQVKFMIAYRHAASFTNM
jgi:transposase InsO family protein